MEQNEEIILELRGVSKRFPGTLAVDRVGLAVKAGEVHAVMGENGAGKSTLMHIIAGSFADYGGEVFVRGGRAELRSPAMARAAGIGMIHQELSLAAPLSVAENILAGRLPTRAGGWLLDRRELAREASRWLLRVGLGELDPLTPVEALSQHEAQLVEIAKALSSNPSILIMDEPTSALSRREVERLFELIAELKCRGLAILYISHHLPEVFQVADRVTVMRDGRRMGTHRMEEVTPPQLVEMMVGRTVSQARVERQREPGRARLVARGLSRHGFFHDVSFQIGEGEILGLAGLAGAGRSELARSICGIDPLDEGELWLDGEEITPGSMTGAMRAGLAYLTENRKLDGLALALTAQENVAAALRAKTGKLTTGRAGRGLFSGLAERLQLHPPEPGRAARQFSGGNQQKLLLGKWLATAPEALILDEPTRGVDVGAKWVIHQAIAALADAGKCVLLISSDLPELVSLADRVVTLRKGRLTCELGRENLTEQAVLLAANESA